MAPIGLLGLPNDIVYQILDLILRDSKIPRSIGCLTINRIWLEIGQELLWSEVVLNSSSLGKFARCAMRGGSQSRVSTKSLTILLELETNKSVPTTDVPRTYGPLATEYLHQGTFYFPETIQAIDDLAQIAPVLTSLTELSVFSLRIRPASGCDFGTFADIPRKVLDIVLQSIPTTCTAFELDITERDAYCVGNPWEPHICKTIHRLLPKLVHLRIVGLAICKDVSVCGNHCSHVDDGNVELGLRTVSLTPSSHSRMFPDYGPYTIVRQSRPHEQWQTIFPTAEVFKVFVNCVPKANCIYARRGRLEETTMTYIKHEFIQKLVEKMPHGYLFIYCIRSNCIWAARFPSTWHTGAMSALYEDVDDTWVSLASGSRWPSAVSKIRNPTLEFPLGDEVLERQGKSLNYVSTEEMKVSGEDFHTQWYGLAGKDLELLQTEADWRWIRIV